MKLDLIFTKCLCLIYCALNFLNVSFANVFKQGKVEGLLVKKKDLEATVEDLQNREKETKNVLQIREV